MHKLKQLTAFLLAAILVFTFMATTVLAAGDPAIRVSEADADQGDTVEVTVSLENNPGIINLKLKVSYNSEALTLTKVKDAGIFGMVYHAPVDKDNPAGNPYILSWANDLATANLTVNGKLVTLTFAVDEDAAPGKYDVKVTYGNGYIYDKDLKPVAFTVFNGAVTVADPDGGDGGTDVSHKFKDVAQDDYFAQAVEWAVKNDITKGISSDMFGPEEACSRAQAVTFLWRAAGSPVSASSSVPFADVAKNSYYYGAVSWAMERGITTGTSRTAFSPDESCSRAQIVTFLWRAADSRSVTSSNPFADVKKDAYYAKAVLWAVKNDITKGISADMFGPDEVCTRAQIVTFLYRYMG